MSGLMGRLRPLALSFAVALGALAPAVAPGTACAASDSHAALVVDTGSRVLEYCVEIGSNSVSGLDLIRLAGQQYGLDYNLGFGGKAVCRLAGVGVSGGDCFGDFPNFWGYWRGTGGGWQWSSTGADNTTVGPGDVEGWSWGKGEDGSSHPQPPATDFSDICKEDRSQDSGSQRDESDSKHVSGSGKDARKDDRPANKDEHKRNDSGGGDKGDHSHRHDDERDSRDRARAREERNTSGAPESQSAPAPPVSGAAGDEAPFESVAMGLVATVFAIGVLTGAGASVIRRRRRS